MGLNQHNAQARVSLANPAQTGCPQIAERIFLETKSELSYKVRPRVRWPRLTYREILTNLSRMAVSKCLSQVVAQKINPQTTKKKPTSPLL